MRSRLGLGFLLCAAAALFLFGCTVSSAPDRAAARESVDLPEITQGDKGSLSDLLHKRRSVRKFGSGEIELQEAARLLFSAQGITRQKRFRTVPSAGALYPLEIYLAAGKVDGLRPGVYRYRPRKHDLLLVQEGDKREELAQAAVGQMWIKGAQAVLAVGAVFERTTSKYGQRGKRYVHIEAGCAAQSVELQAANLGLASTVVGAFHDRRVRSLMGAESEVDPLLLIPVGRLP